MKYFAFKTLFFSFFCIFIRCIQYIQKNSIMFYFFKYFHSHNDHYKLFGKSMKREIGRV